MDTTVILQLATILAVVGSFFGLYRLLVSQKDATIQVLEKRLDLMKAESESVVAKALDERVSLMEREMERMQEDNKDIIEKLSMAETLLGAYQDMLDDNFQKITNQWIAEKGDHIIQSIIESGVELAGEMKVTEEGALVISPKADDDESTLQDESDESEKEQLGNE